MNGESRLYPWLAAALLLVAVPSAHGQDPCTLTPYDASNENGLGAGVGFVIEYCSEMTVPTVCLDRGNYFINAVQVEATETTGASTMPFTAQVRRAIIGVQANPPNEIVAGPVDDTVEDVPNFPSSRTWVTATLDPHDRFSVGLDAVQLTSACAVLDGDVTQGQFLGTDESAGTPLNMCWKGDPPGNPNEDCTIGAPNLRSLRTGLKVSPHGATIDGSQEVPPVTTDFEGILRLGPNTPGSTNFWLEVIHDVPNPTAAHLHNAPPGMNGGIVINLGDPASPIVLPNVDMTAILDELQEGRIYVNIHTAANPGGEIRGQIGSAGDLIFADGFESGDTSSWSQTVP